MMALEIITTMTDVVTCPLNIILFSLCVILIYFIIRPFLYPKKIPGPRLPKMPQRDFTLEELQVYDGTGPDKRILIAVNGKVFDVTNKGQEFYGRSKYITFLIFADGPYASFAGKDASRALACFNVDSCLTKSGYDDLSDLTPEQMKNLREWELQFRDRYDHIGRLLMPGEPHRVYEATEDDQDTEVELISESHSSFKQKVT